MAIVRGIGMLVEDLDSLAAAAQPVVFAGGATRASVGLRVEHSSDADGRVFPQLRAHLHEHELWESFAALKNALDVEVERIFREGDTAAVATTGQIGFSFIRVPTAWAEAFPQLPGTNGLFVVLGSLATGIFELKEALVQQ
jgi:hypothetical protein